MYAVIASGGKQYRVSEGETLRVEKLAGPAGTKVTFGPLLFADDGGGVQVGQPTVRASRSRPRSSSRAWARRSSSSSTSAGRATAARPGHRQPFTALKITAIRAGA